MKKNKVEEVVVRICEFCRIEMSDNYQHIKTKRGSEFYICDKCLSGMNGRKEHSHDKCRKDCK